MEVIFRRTGQRRYGIEARRPGLPLVELSPAPGFDPLLPHDLLHLVVEAALGLTRGVFGQLAAGGLAGSFRLVAKQDQTPREAARLKRRVASRDEKLLHEGRGEAARSERAAYLCWYEWLARSTVRKRRKAAQAMSFGAAHVRSCTPAAEIAALDRRTVDRVCERLDALSAAWQELAIGQAITVMWPDLTISQDV